MFRETLLDSSPVTRKGKRWPMAAAFTTEIIVAGVLILIPLLTTAVIPVSAHVSIVAPLGNVHSTVQKSSDRAGNAGIHLTPVVTLLKTNHNAISFPTRNVADNSNDNFPPTVGVPSGDPTLRLGGDQPAPTLQPVKPKHVLISVLSEAQLLNKVQPVYPPIAVITRIEGDVQLHAVIAKDGTIQSLSVVKGVPILAAAAVDAVKQWKYRPYYLNGEPVEVETFITVSFKRIRD